MLALKGYSAHNSGRCPGLIEAVLAWRGGVDCVVLLTNIDFFMKKV